MLSVDGLNDLKDTPEVELVEGKVVEASFSSACSQQYVRISPMSLSLAVPSRTKGVPLGIVKLGPALTVGIEFPVFVLT